jgi:Tfp pilus assembly protein PilN
MLKSVVVIEVSGATLTLAEVRGSRKQADLLRYLVCRIPKSCPDAECFRQIWQKQGISRQPVVCILPNKIVKFKTLSLPVLPDKQLEAALRIELEGSDDEIVRVFGRWEEATMLNVKAAVIKNRDLVEWLAPLQAAGLEVAWSGYQARGIQNFINFHRGFLQDQCPEAAYLTFSDRRVEFGVISEETILYRRDLELGADDFQNSVNPVAETDLKEELRLSAAAYQAGFGKEPPRSIWLFGKERAALENIRTVLTRAGYQISLNFKIRLGGTVSGEDTPAVAPLLGLALDELGWDSRANLRVYTAAQSEQQELTSRLQMAGKFALAVAILGGGLLLMTQANLAHQAKTTQWLAAQSGKLAKLRQVEADSTAYLAKIKTMESFLDLRGRELEFLLALQKGLPEDTLLTDLTMERGVICNISGVTPSVSLLLNHLQRQPALCKLKLKGNIAVTDQGMERFQLEGPTKAKGIK